MYITTQHVITNNLPFIVFIMMAFILCGIMLIGGWILGGKSSSRHKNTQFESGIISIGNSHIRLSVKFYLVAICFVIFDIETLFLYSWATVIIESGWIGFCEALIFILMILLSLVYLIKTGLMHWIPKRHKTFK